MIDLISFCQVIIMLWVDFWPKFACTLETIDWKTERWHLIVGLLDKTWHNFISKEMTIDLNMLSMLVENRISSNV